MHNPFCTRRCFSHPWDTRTACAGLEMFMACMPQGTGGGSGPILFPSLPPFPGWRAQVRGARQLLSWTPCGGGLGCRVLADGSALCPPGYILTVPGKRSSVAPTPGTLIVLSRALSPEQRTLCVPLPERLSEHPAPLWKVQVTHLVKKMLCA